MVTIIITEDAVAKARPRVSRFGGQSRVYTPKKSQEFEYVIRRRAEEKIKKPMDGPISVEIDLQIKRPKNLAWKKKEMPKCYNTKRPDIDNYAKSVLDGLNGVAFKDDGQVAELIIRKWYHAGGERPTTTIKITKLVEK
jgi:Holliday junction resolvase RusA-like endonuclease